MGNTSIFICKTPKESVLFISHKRLQSMWFEGLVHYYILYIKILYVYCVPYIIVMEKLNTFADDCFIYVGR